MSDVIIKTNLIDGSLENLLNSIDFYLDSSIQETNRLQKNTLFWDLYKGNHWTEAEQDEDQPTPAFNKIKIIIRNKLKNFF